MGITEEQYQQLLRNKKGAAQKPPPKKKNKYNAKATYVDNIFFASKLEAQYYQKLLARQQRKEIKYFLRQVPIRLPALTTYYCDFMIVENDNTIRWIDTKGKTTKMFELKKRQVETLYPHIKIEVIRK